MHLLTGFSWEFEGIAQRVSSTVDMISIESVDFYAAAKAGAPSGAVISG